MNEKIVRMNEHGICPDKCAGRGVGGWWSGVGLGEKGKHEANATVCKGRVGGGGGKEGGCSNKLLLICSWVYVCVWINE